MLLPCAYPVFFFYFSYVWHYSTCFCQMSTFKFPCGIICLFPCHFPWIFVDHVVCELLSPVSFVIWIENSCKSPDDKRASHAVWTLEQSDHFASHVVWKCWISVWEFVIAASDWRFRVSLSRSCAVRSCGALLTGTQHSLQVFKQCATLTITGSLWPYPIITSWRKAHISDVTKKCPRTLPPSPGWLTATLAIGMGAIFNGFIAQPHKYFTDQIISISFISQNQNLVYPVETTIIGGAVIN